MRRLVLVRHGESVWNVVQRVQGHTCHGLTDHGHVQARRTGELLGDWLGEAEVVTSDLGRCVDTAAPIAAALGVVARPDEALRERSFGSWEGLDREGLEAQDPERYARWRAGQDVIAEVGGESDAMLRARASGIFSTLLAAQDGPETVVAVTHGGTIWYGVHALLRTAGYHLGFVDNASITELILGGRGPAGVDPSSPRLMRFNETGHLR